MEEIPKYKVYRGLNINECVAETYSPYDYIMKVCKEYENDPRKVFVVPDLSELQFNVDLESLWIQVDIPYGYIGIKCVAAFFSGQDITDLMRRLKHQSEISHTDYYTFVKIESNGI